MDFPFCVTPDLDDAQVHRFHAHVNSNASGWHRKWTESIWRRHQHPSNAVKSGWRGEDDHKRRLIHFYDEYDLEGRDFVLRRAYLSLNLTLPAEHIEEYRNAIADRMRHGEWRRTGTEDLGGLMHDVYRRGDLLLRLAHCDVHPEDARRNKAPPSNYRNLSLSLLTAGTTLPPGWDERPWRVFHEVGLRKILKRGTPHLIEPEAIAEWLPAQVELGCGPSLEAGIPELSTLHRIYGVSHPDYSFVFRAKDDSLLDVLASPAAKYAEMTNIYGACMLAKSTGFYDGLVDLHRRGLLVGPVITNNFDCQCADLGLPEISLRRYDWGPYYPKVEHHPAAKSLLVVGVHADRRLVQMRARDQGLKVIFIDPENYVGPDGRQINYPVEAPQDEDLFVRATADVAMRRLRAAIVDK